ncbi:MAG: hypothetical protein PHQ03_04920 [Methylococcales bacterium]|nr:hypothetical protein [Methylococcales bacterium]
MSANEIVGTVGSGGALSITAAKTPSETVMTLCLMPVSLVNKSL